MSGSIDFKDVKLKEIAYLPQQSEVDHYFPLTVKDVVMLGFWSKLGPFRGASSLQYDAAHEALRAVGMEMFAERSIEALSTGQWRRVLFARLILQDARILLLDEPFAGIDLPTTHALLRILERWQKEGRTVIAVMHDLEMVRENFVQSLMVARELIAWGPTKNVLSEENMARAKIIAGKWVEDAHACQRDERLSA